MHIESLFPGGGRQTYVGLHLASVHLGHCGLVNCVLLETLAAQGTGLALPDSLRAAAGFGIRRRGPSGKQESMHFKKLAPRFFFTSIAQGGLK